MHGWRGAGILNGGKGFADTPMGQVFYRDRGPKNSHHTLVLLHQTPMFTVEFAEAQDALAALGIRSIALDTPGYGLSDHPSGSPSIADFAANVLATLDQLKLQRVVIVGHHTGASVATAFAARYPHRTAGVILHGTPLYTAEEAAERRMRALPVVGVLRPDGSHMSDPFRAGLDANARLDPYGATWATMGMFLQGEDIGHKAAFSYDMAPDLRAIAAPGLILSDLHDMTHHLDLRAASMRPDFQYVELSDGDALTLMTEPKNWANAVRAWVQSLP